MLREALLAAVRRTLRGRVLGSKLLRLSRRPLLAPSVGMESVSIFEVGDVVERKRSMGELVAELPAVDGRPAFELARVMEGEDGRPMNRPECLFDSGTDGRSTGDPRRPCDDGDGPAGGVSAACSCAQCWASYATGLCADHLFAPSEEGPDEGLSIQLGARCELERDSLPPYRDVSGNDASAELACELGLP